MGSPRLACCATCLKIPGVRRALAAARAVALGDGRSATASGRARSLQIVFWQKTLVSIERGVMLA